MRAVHLLLLALLAVCLLGSLQVAEAKSRDFYKILDVSREATQQQIQKAYRKLSLQYHPDKHPGDAKAAQKFEDVKTAYEVLSDPEKRQTYDLDGEEGLEQANQPQMDDPFAAFFGGGGGRRGGKQKGPNMGSEAEVTLDELYNGAQRKIRLQKNVICPKCRGTGAKDGAVKKCHACNGKGTRLTMQQMMPGFNVQMQTTCDVCGGKGTTAAQKCKHCNGNKVIREDKSLDLIIERGMPDGHEVVFEKEGEQAPNVIPGDVVIKLRTRPHNVFKRRGDDLLMEVQVTLKEALLGFKRRVIHLDHHVVELVSDKVLQHNHVMIIPNEGMPKFEFPSERGNLEATIKVQMPRSLSEQDKEALRALFAK